MAAMVIAAKVRYGLHAGVGAAELDALGLRVLRVHGDTAAGRAVAGRHAEVDRGLEARDQAAVGVGRGRGEAEDGRGVLENAADGVQAQFAEARVALAQQA